MVADDGHEQSVVNEAIERLTKVGVPVPDDVRAQLAKLIAPVDVSVLDRRPDVEKLVEAWRATRSAPPAEDIVWIVLLTVFNAHFTGFVPGLKEALQAHHMGIARTRTEVRLRLGGRLFFAGRHMIADGTGIAPGRWLLSEAVDTLTGVARDEQNLRDEQRRGFHGQIGVASVILARGDQDPSARLDVAEAYFLSAEKLGDHTEEHYAYLAEIYLRRYALNKDPAEIESGAQVIEQAPVPSTRRLLAASADIAGAKALISFRSGDPSPEVIKALRDAEAEYGIALGARDESTVSDGYLLARRGHIRHVLYRTDVDSAGRRRTEVLHEALSDLLDERARDHTNPDSTSHALLDRARVRQRRNDAQGAKADIEEMRRILHADDASALVVKARAIDLEQQVFAAVTRRDIAAVKHLIGQIVDLPASTPLPTAGLVRGVKMLAADVPSEDARPVLLAALDRLEIDLDHPALTPMARRHAAGHAALVSWLLVRRGYETDLLERTIALYRMSFEALDVRPSLDALANAGTCALALAKHRLRGDEADAEEALGLLASCVEWLGEALARAPRATPRERRGLDAGIAHSRLGEAAVRAYPLTQDPAYLDLAITHLQHAVDDGETPASVVGLLGDAYYRRGMRPGDVEDLERALAFKEAAHESGHESRENRSVSAAAAIRMFRLTGDESMVTYAARCALQAAVADETWPWAVLQIADLAQHHHAIQAGELSDEKPEDLVALLLAGNRPALLYRAAELSVRSPEFASSTLGGQRREGARGVFVLNDPHRLIEQAIVLKQLSRQEAEREFEWTRALKHWLSAHEADPIWLLPEPLGVVDAGPDSTDGVYVMRRRQGRLLGALVVEAHGRSGAVEDHLPKFVQALTYLAAFQTWRRESAGDAWSGTDQADTLYSHIERHGERLGLSTVTTELIKQTVNFCEAPADYPYVPKKDPHPGNWLWSPREELVMIDVETTGSLPLLYEVAVLIDDLPLLPVTTEGWLVRRRLCQQYVDDLIRWGWPGDGLQAVPVEAYDAFVLIRAVVGISRLIRNDPGASSYSTSYWRLQFEHYSQLVEWLAANESTSLISKAASRVRDELSAVLSSH